MVFDAGVEGRWKRPVRVAAMGTPLFKRSYWRADVGDRRGARVKARCVARQSSVLPSVSGMNSVSTTVASMKALMKVVVMLNDAP